MITGILQRFRIGYLFLFSIISLFVIFLETPKSGEAQSVDIESKISDGYEKSSQQPQPQDLLESFDLEKQPADFSSLLPDIDVLFIERHPRLYYDGTQKWPKENEIVTFIAHIKNNGNTPLESFNYSWKIDDVVVQEGVEYTLNVGEIKTISYQWRWQHQIVNDRIQGSHTVEFVVDPKNLIDEISETNNNIKDFTQGLAIGFWVEQKVYDFFNQNQLQYCSDKSCVGSNSWEDWAQRQIRLFNNLLASSKSTQYPNGAIDRVRLDKVTVLPDCTISYDNFPPADNTYDLVWGFTSAKVEPVSGCTRDLEDGNKRLYQVRPDFQNLEHPLIHELSHARYLIDLYGLDVYTRDVLVVEDGALVANTSLLPEVSPGIVYKSKEQGIMSGEYYGKYEAHSIGALNRVAGLRARGGNYNAPAVIGEYLLDLPQVIKFQFLTQNGLSIPFADIQIYQAKPNAGEWYGKVFEGTPDIIGKTDSQGVFTYIGNPFGESISHRYGFSNLVFLYRIKAGTDITYGFQEITDLNHAYWKGYIQEAVVPVKTALSSTFLPTTRPLLADANNDLRVDLLDFEILKTQFGQNGPFPINQDSDFNKDNVVNLLDFNILLIDFNESV